MGDRRPTPPAVPAAGPPAFTDRRAAERRLVQMQVVIQPVLDAERRPLPGSPRRARSRDLTTHGTLVGRTGYLPLRSLVWLFFVLPDCMEVSCHGVVVRLEPQGDCPRYGIKFLGLRPTDELRLQSFLLGCRA